MNRAENLRILATIRRLKNAQNFTLTVPIEELRRRAYDAAEASRAVEWKEARRSYRERSNSVNQDVLARANGICELTGKAAPFQKKDGSAYLEIHHTRRLSDDGPDHPPWVAVIDPTVHREIHFRVRGDELNETLKKRLAEIAPQD